MFRSVLWKVPFFWSILINPALPNTFMSAIPLPTPTPMGLCVTEILGIVCQRMALGEFSLIDHDMTDKDGLARNPATISLCYGNLSKIRPGCRIG